jgi:hypothetical protein
MINEDDHQRVRIVVQSPSASMTFAKAIIFCISRPCAVFWRRRRALQAE